MIPLSSSSLVCRSCDSAASESAGLTERMHPCEAFLQTLWRAMEKAGLPVCLLVFSGSWCPLSGSVGVSVNDEACLCFLKEKLDN